MENEKKKRDRAMRSLMGKQGVLLISSILLLIASVVYMTFAWYTRTVNTGDASFDIAQWDFSADHSIVDFVIDVTKYSNVSNGKAGPGTSGTIPVKISALDSDTAVNYRLRAKLVDAPTASDSNLPATMVLDTEVLKELRNRIRFYHLVNGEKVILSGEEGENIYFYGTVSPHGTSTETLYWEWVYELPVEMKKESNSYVIKFTSDTIQVYEDGGAALIKEFPSTELRNATIEAAKPEGYDVADRVPAMKDGKIINFNGQQCSYYTQLSDAVRELLMTDASTVGKFTAFQSATDDANAFDVQIGRNPDAYEAYLKLQVHIEGVQAYPEVETKAENQP